MWLDIYLGILLPIDATNIPPNPMARGPPHARNLSLGAQAAVKDKEATTPAVQAAARTTRGPPSNINGAMTRPTTLL